MIDFIVGLPVLIFLMWLYGTWPAGPGAARASLHVPRAGDGARRRLLLSALNVRYQDVRYMIPVFLQVLPLLSGVMYAVEEIPTKWQWILAFNPMTAVIAGWRWAMLDASTPDLGQTAVASPSPSSCSSAASGSSVPPSRSSRTPSDGRRSRRHCRRRAQALPDRRAQGRVRDAPRVDVASASG